MSENIEDKIWKIVVKIRTGKEVTLDDDTTILSLLDLYQKEKEKNEKIKEQIEKRISQCECEKLETTMGINDDHYQYWDCFKGILERLLQELLEERN